MKTSTKTQTNNKVIRTMQITLIRMMHMIKSQYTPRALPQGQVKTSPKLGRD